MRLLLAEDQEDIRLLFQMLLASRGHEVVAVSDGLEAVEEFARGEAFDGVILDVGMPRVDGEAAARLVRLVEALRPGRAPACVAFLTGYSQSQEMLVARAASGVTRFWQKPVEAASFVEDVAAWLSEGSGRKADGA